MLGGFREKRQTNGNKQKKRTKKKTENKIKKKKSNKKENMKNKARKKTKTQTTLKSVCVLYLGDGFINNFGELAYFIHRGCINTTSTLLFFKYIHILCIPGATLKFEGFGSKHPFSIWVLF